MTAAHGSSAPEEFAAVLDRDLAALAGEVRSYPAEEDLWRTGGEIRNPGGTLALHLAGNLRHFVGAELGRSGYVRDREAEFAGTPVPRERILEVLEAARTEVAAALAGLDEGDLSAPWPGRAPTSLGPDPSTRLVLLHLAGHLMYHLGQVNYHRRLLAAG